MGTFIKKILSFLLINLILLNLLNVEKSFSDAYTYANSYVSTLNGNNNYKPWDNIIFNIGATNTNNIESINPFLYFKTNLGLNYIQNSWSGFVQFGRTSTIKPIIETFDPISFTWVLNWVNLPYNNRFWVRNLTYNIPMNYPKKTITYEAFYWSDNFTTYKHPWTNDAVLHVNVTPHIQSIDLSKWSIYNNWTDSLDLTVKIIDFNGCSNLVWWSSYVNVDLSSLWLTNESLTYQSCESDWFTAIFKRTWIKPNPWYSPWTYNFLVTASDSDWNIAWSDSYYASYDLVKNWNIIVNSSSSPEITFLNYDSNSLYWPNNNQINLNWQSNQNWNYIVNVWLNPTCSTWINVWSWTLISNSVINTTFNYSSAGLVNWLNKLIICVTNNEPTVWSNMVNINIDTKSPVIDYITYSQNIWINDVNLGFNLDEDSTYKIYINWNFSWLSWTWIKNQNIILNVPNSLFTINPGNNDLYISSEDKVWNIWNSRTFQVYKDYLPPPPVTNLLAQDCDFIWNTTPICKNKWNPKNWVSWRDFYLQWTPPAEFDGFASYVIYILPFWTPFNTNVQSSIKQVWNIFSTWTLLDDNLLQNSLGQTLSQTWSVKYDLYVLTRKSNFLLSDFAKTTIEVNSDNVILPKLQEAKFVWNDVLELSYSKNLSTNLNDYNSSWIKSLNNCFSINTDSWTWALYVNDNKVWFKINSLNSTSKTCNDLSIDNKTIYDYEGLYNEEVISNNLIKDWVNPLININSPSNWIFVWGNWNFNINYTFWESMSWSTIKIQFQNSSWATLDYPISINTLSWTYNLNLNWNVLWLQDWKKYSFKILWEDISWNLWESNLIMDFVYDITSPTKPNLINLFWENWIIWNKRPTFEWISSSDNYSNILKYKLQISKNNLFNQIVVDTDELTGNWTTLISDLELDWTYYYRISSKDESWNISSFSDILSFKLDTTPWVFYTADTYVNNKDLWFQTYVKNWNHIDIFSKLTDSNQSYLLNTDFKANLSLIWGGSNQNATSFNTTTWLLKWENLLINCSSDWSKDIILTSTDKGWNVSQITTNVICDNTPPNLLDNSIISPVENEFIKWNNAYLITWDQNFYSEELSKISNPISISYSIDWWTNWNNLALNIENNWSYNWNVPNINSQVKLKISAIDKLWNRNDIIKNITVDSTSPVIWSDTLLNFNSWSIYKGGQHYSILWNSGSISDNIWLKTTPIKLEYSLNWWTNWNLIIDNISNSWNYDWLVPSVNTNNLKIRLTAIDKSLNSSSIISSGFNVIDSINPILTINYAWGWSYWGATPPNLAYINNSWIDLSLNSTDDYLSWVYYSILNKNTWKYWNWNSFSSDNLDWKILCQDLKSLWTNANCSNILNSLNFLVENSSSYDLKFKSIDEAWNETISQILNYTSDLIKPDLLINWTWSLYFSWNLNINWTAFDNLSWLSSVNITVKKDWNYWNWNDFLTWSQLLLTNTDNSYLDWNYDFTPSYLEEDWQNYNVEVFAYDKSYKVNNVETKSKTIILDKSWPSLSWNSLVFDTTKIYTWGTLVTVSWDKDKIIDLWVWLTSNPIVISYNVWSWITQIASNVPNTWSYSFNLPVVDVSTAKILLKAVDKLWNESQNIFTNNFIIDSTPPLISKVETKSDWIDSIWWVIVYFSEIIKDINLINVSSIFSSSQWSFKNEYSYSTIDWKTVLELNFNTNITGTNATPTIQFNWWILKDLAWNNLESWNIISIDKAEPRVVSSEIFDENWNWKFDKIEAKFSENINSTTDFSAFVINNPLNWMSILSIVISWNKATLNLNESVLPNTDSRGITLNFNSNSNYKDLSWNQAGSLGVSKNLIDKSKPIILSAKLKDNNFVPNILELEFSEELYWTISGFWVNSWVINYSNKNWNILTFNFSWVNSTNPDIKLSYSGLVKDINDNLLNWISDFSINELISPKLISWNTLDLDNNWRIDWILVNFSESITWNFLDFFVSWNDINFKSGNQFTFSWSNSIILPIDEKTEINTSFITNFTIENNSNLKDLSWNNIKPNQTINIEDWVWVVIKQSRFDESNSKMYLTFSENIQTLNLADFDYLWMWWVINNLEFISGSNSAILTFSNNVIDYANAKISFKPNTVWDDLWNKVWVLVYSKITASIIINEVYSDINLKYIELKNLSWVNVNISWYVIKNALWNGLDYTIPNWSNISANWYYLISSNNSYYSWVVWDNIVWLNISSNLYLENSWVLVDWFLFKSFSTKKSLQRVEWCWNGLESNCFVNSVWSNWFLDSSYRWTPKSFNITDYILPNVSSYSPINDKIIPKNNSLEFSFNYEDNTWWVWIDTATSKLEIYKFDWNQYNKIDWLTSTWTINTVKSSYIFNWVSQYWKYKAVFNIWDYAWNYKTQNIDFYIDDFKVTLDKNNLDLWSINSWILKYWNDFINIQVKTIWSKFSFNHEITSNLLWNYSWWKWFWWCVWENCTNLENFSNKNIVSIDKDLSNNGNLKIYNFKIKYWVLVDNNISAWDYNISNKYNFIINY